MIAKQQNGSGYGKNSAQQTGFVAGAALRAASFLCALRTFAVKSSIPRSALRTPQS
jgi:hypothetical protein